MSEKPKKEFAVIHDRGYVLVENDGEKRIYDEYGCVVIPNAENGWTDLLDYIIREGKNV